MSDQPTAYRVEIPVHLCHEIGLDPADLPEHRTAQIAGVRSLHLCAGLFWAMRQLSLLAQHGGWVYTPSDLYEALDALGEIGQAVALSASDHVERLEQLTERHAQAAAAAGQGGDE